MHVIKVLFFFFLDKTTTSLSIKSSLIIFFCWLRPLEKHTVICSLLQVVGSPRNFFPPSSSRQSLKAAKTMPWLKKKSLIPNKTNQFSWKFCLDESTREGMNLVLSLPLNLALTWTLWPGVAQKVWRDKTGDLCSNRPEILIKNSWGCYIRTHLRPVERNLKSSRFFFKKPQKIP